LSYKATLNETRMRIAPRHSVYTLRDPGSLMLQIPGCTELTWNCIPANVTDRKNDGTRATWGSRAKISSVPREWRLSVTNASRHGKRKRGVPVLVDNLRLACQSITSRVGLVTTIVVVVVVVVVENFPVSSRRRQYFREGDWSILYSSTTVPGLLNASRHFPRRVDDR